MPHTSRLYALTFVGCSLLVAASPARADPPTADNIVIDGHSQPSAAIIQQGTSVNRSYVAVTDPKWSAVVIAQNGRNNGVLNYQKTEDVAYSKILQNGWRNFLNTFQVSDTTIHRSAQQIPQENIRSVGTKYEISQTDQGVLTVFESGDFSFASLTSPNLTYASSFGRAH